MIYDWCLLTFGWIQYVRMAAFKIELSQAILTTPSH